MCLSDTSANFSRSENSTVVLEKYHLQFFLIFHILD